MLFILLQVVAVAAVAVFLRQWRAAVRRRNEQTWDSLVSRLRPDLSARDWKEVSNASPEEKWNRTGGATGLWALYQNAGVMLELADYAVRNGDTVNREMLQSLRSDAMQIRASVAMALAKYAFSQVNEGICVNAQRAASMYTEMAARMTEFVQAGGSNMVPDFAGAM
jgi:hypothetical protein